MAKPSHIRVPEWGGCIQHLQEACVGLAKIVARGVIIHQRAGTGKLYTLDSAYGSKDELVALVKELKAAGISPVADIVINHRCAQEQDESGVWNSYSYALACHVAPILHHLASWAAFFKSIAHFLPNRSGVPSRRAAWEPLKSKASHVSYVLGFRLLVVRLWELGVCLQRKGSGGIWTTEGPPLDTINLLPPSLPSTFPQFRPSFLFFPFSSFFPVRKQHWPLRAVTRVDRVHVTTTEGSREQNC